MLLTSTWLVLGNWIEHNTADQLCTVFPYTYTERHCSKNHYRFKCILATLNNLACSHKYFSFFFSFSLLHLHVQSEVLHPLKPYTDEEPKGPWANIWHFHNRDEQQQRLQSGFHFWSLILTSVTVCIPLWTKEELEADTAWDSDHRHQVAQFLCKCFSEVLVLFTGLLAH